MNAPGRPTSARASIAFSTSTIYGLSNDCTSMPYPRFIINEAAILYESTSVILSKISNVCSNVQTQMLDKIIGLFNKPLKELVYSFQLNMVILRNDVRVEILVE